MKKTCKILVFLLTLSVVLSLSAVYAAAPVAEILSPQNNTSFTKGVTTSFTGSGSDLEDGALTGSQLVWVSDKDGRLGKGEMVSTRLSSGSHIITLTVTDSSGNPAAKSITITVVK